MKLYILLYLCSIIYSEKLHIRQKRIRVVLIKEETAEQKWNTTVQRTIAQMGTISKTILHQSSSENEGWKDAAIRLSTYISPNAYIEICSSPMKMNYVHFINYLNHRRQQYHKTTIDQLPDVEVLRFKPNEVNPAMEKEMRNQLRFTIEFNQTSKYDYESNTFYHITAEEEQVSKDDYKWRIVKIVEGGGCTDSGFINKSAVYYDKTDYGYLTDVPTGVAMTIASESGLPDLEQKLEKGAFFEGRVCTNPEVIYNQAEFLKYMKQFFRRWKYVNDSVLQSSDNIDEIVDKPDQYIFKYKMQLTLNESRFEEEWYWKVSARYNTHGNSKWLINKISLICPVGMKDHRPLRDKYADMIVNQLIEGMKSEILLNGDWIYAYQFVRNLERGEEDRIAVTDCNDLKSQKFGLKFWHSRMKSERNFTATFKEATAYKIDGDLLKFSVRSDIHEKGKSDQQKDLAIEMSYDDKYDRWWITALKVGCTSKRSMEDEIEYYKYEVENGQDEGGGVDHVNYLIV